MNLRLRDEHGKCWPNRAMWMVARALASAGGPSRCVPARRWRPKACVNFRRCRSPPKCPARPACRRSPPWWTCCPKAARALRCASADRNEAAEAHPLGVRRLLEIALADKLKQARKQLPVSPRPGCCAAIESQERCGDLVEAALNAVLAEGLGDIRDRRLSSSAASRPAKRLFGEAMERLQLAEKIMAGVAEVKPALEAPLMGWARGSRTTCRRSWPRWCIRASCATRRPMRFRSCRVISRQWCCVPNAPSATRPATSNACSNSPFIEALADAALDGRLKRPGWQALRWELEELRVSVFAQELGARGGVSPKKLAQHLAALRTGAK
jgi:ATP-dependent helicase HrpA